MLLVAIEAVKLMRESLGDSSRIGIYRARPLFLVVSDR